MGVEVTRLELRQKIASAASGLIEMLGTARIFVLVFFILTPTFAGSWSGVLVDAACYEREERNINVNDTTFDVDRDRDFEIRQCLPSTKTKAFAVVQQNGQSFELDSTGNAKAATLIPKTGKKSRIYVAVRGQEDKAGVIVDSIVLNQLNPARSPTSVTRRTGEITA
jgi:hypothetical protein